MKTPEKNRVKTGARATTKDDGNNGIFVFTRQKCRLHVVISDGMQWEHVSITRDDRKMPTWYDMCYIKNKFWDSEETVMQLHPPESSWISNHNKCLHLWRPSGITPASQIPLPPDILVGVKGMNSVEAEKLAHQMAENK